MFVLYVELVDAFNRNTAKRFAMNAGVTTFALAQTAATDLLTDLEAVTEARILAYTISERTVYTDSVTSGANRDEGVTLSVRKEDSRKDVLRIPAPVKSFVNPDSTVDITATPIVNYTDNFLAAGEFTLSDGESIAEVLSGVLDS